MGRRGGYLLLHNQRRKGIEEGECENKDCVPKFTASTENLQCT